jgi:hypothetical protein
LHDPLLRSLVSKSGELRASDRLSNWCKQEQASIQQQLELMEAAKVLTA